MNSEICAVIVTYNRKELLLRNIQSILKQNIEVDMLIFDNASSDNTYEYLLENDILSKDNILYYREKRNIGGAGGFSSGAKMAVEKGYKYVWLMDDDGYCINEHTLSNLLVAANNKKVIVNSYVTYNAETMEPTFKIKDVQSYKKLQKYIDNDRITGSGSPYNGTLVPRECFLECGYPQARFFIYGDEYEFFLRTNRAGYNWIICVDSLYFHPINRNIVGSINLFGKTIECLEQPIWKFYLDIRNTEYIKKEYYKNYNIMGSYLKVFILSLMAKDKHIKRLKYGFLAIKDGRTEFFDRPLMFEE